MKGEHPHKRDSILKKPVLNCILKNVATCLHGLDLASTQLHQILEYTKNIQ